MIFLKEQRNSRRGVMASPRKSFKFEIVPVLKVFILLHNLPHINKMTAKTVKLLNQSILYKAWGTDQKDFKY